ncbi:hypothetical protein FRC11_008182 [Ceratobasidium sp. 423]|nr:hypothetical protein FRC11_008182 [Ceratobasidium sp. 423]
MNGKGQLPLMHHLPPISTYDSTRLSGSITAQNLVGYLGFYDICMELIEEGTENLKPDKEADAQRLLAYYLYYNRPPVTQAA